MEGLFSDVKDLSSILDEETRPPEPAPPPVTFIPKITDLIRTAWSGIIRQKPLNVLPEDVERILGKSIYAATTSAARQPWQLYALVGVISIQNMLVILGNTPRMSVWLLTLLAVGVGQGCLLPSAVGWLGGLATIVVWVLFRRATGVWVSAELFQSVFEVVGLSLSLALVIWIRHNWENLQHELRELRPLREVLVAGEVGTGLLPREVGELRMIEEVDRSRVFRRPLGLLLVEIEPLPMPSISLVELKEVYQALNRQLGSVSLVHDIPFRAASNRMGLIMPEREWDKLYDDAESIVNVLKQGSFLDGEGRPQSVLDCVKLSFGVGTYQGETEGAIDLMRAAEDSLSISRDLAHLGEISVSAYAMPATPIAESVPIRSYAQE